MQQAQFLSVLSAEEDLVQCYGYKQDEVTFYNKAFPSGFQEYNLFYCRAATKTKHGKFMIS